VRVGADVASVSAVDRSIERFGDRYLRRIFTPSELADCSGAAGLAVESLAARFAAKEAAMKALRPGGQQIDWRSIEVRREIDGSCSLALTDQAARLANATGLDDLAVALSHEGDIALAVVIALSNAPKSNDEPKGI
jgi:holo-[acyl-carrier protein] synthase